MEEYDLIGDDDDLFGSIGADLLIGDDEDDLLDALSVEGLGNSELVGAAKKLKKAKVNAALQKIAMRNAGGVISRPLDRKRRYPLGFVPTTITASTTSSIPASPQNLFKAERMVIPSDIAFDLGVTDIKVGTQSQFVQNVEVPAAIFSEVSIDTNVWFDSAEIGNQIALSLRNKTAADVAFSGALIGAIAK